MEHFIERPNLPGGRISLAAVDRRIPEEVEEKLAALGIRLIKNGRIAGLYEAVSSHPDIAMHHIGGDSIVVAPNINDATAYRLEEEGFRIIPGKKAVGAKYPDNIPYNAARFGNYAACNIKYSDEVLLDELTRSSVNIINIRQGYAKCSLCIADENSVITSDAGIYRALREKNISSLLISPGNIELFDMEYGFIGGASGMVSDTDVAFFGDLKTHPNYIEIKIFLSKLNKKIFNLSKNTLQDLGTLIPLKEYSILTP